MFVDYLNMDKGANVGGLTNALYTVADFKGWAVGFNYAVAKNIVFLAAHHLAVAIGGVEPFEANPALGQRFRVNIAVLWAAP